MRIKIKMVREAFEVMTALLKIAVLRDKYIPEEPRDLLKCWRKELVGIEELGVDFQNPLYKEWREMLIWKEKYENTEKEEYGPTENEIGRKDKEKPGEKSKKEEAAILSDFEYYVWGVLLQFND